MPPTYLLFLVPVYEYERKQGLPRCGLVNSKKAGMSSCALNVDSVKSRDSRVSKN